MWCFNYQLISVTAIALISVHKVMIDTLIRLYFTYADLQINVYVNIKSLSFHLLLLMHLFFSIGACDLCLYLYLLLFKTCLMCMSSTLDILKSTLLYLLLFKTCLECTSSTLDVLKSTLHYITCVQVHIRRLMSSC